MTTGTIYSDSGSIAKGLAGWPETWKEHIGKSVTRRSGEEACE